MDISDIKKELNSYRYDLDLIEEMKCEIEEYRNKATSCTSQLNDMPSGSKKIQDKIAEYAAIIADLEKEKYDLLIAMEQNKQKIENKIMQIDQPYRNILFFSYIRGLDLNKVAVRINYSYKWTCDLHITALEKYAELEAMNK